MSASVVTASELSLKFSKLSVNDGLTQSTVNAIVQDKQGYLWFATADGLDRYDGYQFKHYRYDRYNDHSLSQNEVQALIVDDLGRLWVGTYDGINLYDATLDHFIRYQYKANDINSLSNNMIFSFYKDQQGIIWIGTNGGGLNRLDPKTLTFSHYKYNPNDKYSLNNNHVWPIYENSQGFLWVGTQGGGLSRFDPKQQKFESILYIKEQPNHPHNYISALNIDSFDNIWVGTSSGLLYRDNKTKEWTTYQHNDNDLYSLSHNNIWTLHRDLKRRLWIGTDGGGLNLFDPKKKHFNSYQFDIDTSSISSNSILSLYTDKANHLWVGTDKGGLNQGWIEKFSHYYQKSISINNQSAINLITNKLLSKKIRKKRQHGSLSHNNIYAISQDKPSTLWVGTANGLNHLNLETGTTDIFLHEPDNYYSLPGNNIKTLFHDRCNRLWIGTDSDYLSLLIPDTDNFINYRLHTQQGIISNNEIKSIISDNETGLWIGTKAGLSHFDIETSIFTHKTYDDKINNKNQLNHNFITDLYLDKQDILWIATDGGGLNRFDTQTEIFTHYTHISNKNSISNNSISMLHTDKNENLWIATFGGGINHFNVKTEKFIHYGENTGLLNDMVYSILEDNDNKLWLTSNKGLSHFNPQNSILVNYDVSDGLQSSEFNPKSAFKSKNGQMFIGGINGFNSFFPDRIQNNYYPPPVVLNQLKILNTKMNVGDKNSPLTKALIKTKSIRLSSKQSTFSLKFSALNFLFPEQNNYAYRLKGFDKQWINIQNRREAYYTKVPAGHYTFEVKASNNDKVWGDLTTKIDIIIIPPWWLTWWFQLLSISLLIFLIYLGYNTRITIIQSQKKRLEKIVNERTLDLQKAKQIAEKANHSKSAFLANISHELRTPLNGILGYAQILQDDVQLSEQSRKNINIIEESGEYLLTLINDVLDIAQIEANKLQLYPKPINLSQLLNSVGALIQMRAQQKNIILETYIDKKLNHGVLADDKRLRQILLNLLGNAVKFTHKGTIILNVTQLEYDSLDQVHLEFQIKDSGIGMSENDIQKIFKPFEQVGSQTQRSQGTGLGLAISQRLVRLMNGEIHVKSAINKGSCFWFKILLPRCYLPKTKNIQRKIIGYLGEKRLILIVDDIRVNRLLLRQLLKIVGFNTLEAENGKIAIEQAKKHKPDLILMDLFMPELDGFGACMYIRQHEKTADIPIVALSANMLEQSKNHEQAHYFNDFLSKPIKKDKLLACLKHQLGMCWQYKEHQ